MIFFRFLSRLPLPILYGISDVLSFLLLYIIRYRRKVVLENLRLSFPEKSPADIQAVAKGFYKNLGDLIVETIKQASLPPEFFQKHIRFPNIDLIQKRILAGETVIGMSSHQANWEWIPAALVLNKMPVDSIYKPLTSPFFEQLMIHIRSHLGPVPTPMNSLPRQMVLRKHIPRIIGLISDQVPDVPEQAYWTDFLHRDSPFYPGSERLARSRKMAVFFFDIVRVRRSYYEVTFRLIAEPPYDDLPPGAIMEGYRDVLETSIRNNPSDWLWSHKRWKHWRGKYAKVSAKLS
ncbi:lysophospholipid acyltransferase family protein [Spirosoma pollinicola]|uniref:Lipid A biosynthesis acyltransferase n=1 Tax=Spirosoma pollinicola TaxID=2057025 RepID=A0A2K8YVR3_9BACT|nr:lysophospholipid acyltransferase family protein [Spirosoma pollinicola]AUD01664.1 lipid A biosynthesis acyltransferase [Spirosoma pollinicola]